MKPFKVASGLSQWVLRLILAVHLVFFNLDALTPVDLQSINFYLAVVSILLAALLVWGGLRSKPTLTVVSGLLIFLLSAYLVGRQFDLELNAQLIAALFPAATGFFFFANGNGR